jgi:hypothetical protein
MGRIYNVVFNSAIGAGATNNETFFYDWSQLEEGRYKCSFSFMSGHNPAAFADGNNVANLFMELGQGAYTAIAANSSGSVYLPSYIGSLETRSIPTAAGAGTNVNYYYASTVTNPPFYLDNRPRNNNINIYMATNGANQSTAFTPVTGPYTLTLQLEKVD